jgi:hypothetical protein
VDCGEKPLRPAATRKQSFSLDSASWLVVEGADGEIQRRRETAAESLGQGKPEVIPAMGG